MMFTCHEQNSSSHLHTFCICFCTGHYSHTSLHSTNWWTQKEQVCFLVAVLIYLRLMHNDFVWLYCTLFRRHRNVMWWDLFAYILPSSSCCFWMTETGGSELCFPQKCDAFLPPLFLMCVLLQVRVPSCMYITGACALWSERQYCD